jgi:SPP1 family phage portal protein
MNYRKTNFEHLDAKQIEKFITEHYAECQRLTKLWDYYKGNNTKILSKPKVQEGNPDNRTPVPFGRKIITTFTGYAYRPKYITYKTEEKDQTYFKQLMENFKLNNEPIKTAMDGRNTGIFGLSYELVYVDTEIGEELTKEAVPRFFYVDPREIILLYDYSPEPKKKIGIRYYPITDDWFKVEVYYKETVEVFDRKREANSNEWVITPDLERPMYMNFFQDVPIVPYYFGDDCLGIIQPVIPLIDDYDDLISGSIIEFDRFANAYLRLVKMGIGGRNPVPNGGQPDNQAWQWLARLRKSRVFENLESKEDVSFLTKDIPKDFVEWMEKTLAKQIHTQSSVPDFAQFTDVSGAAIERLMFDFENVVSSAEADFDTGLYERIRLINKIWETTKSVQTQDPGTIVITHKRNVAFDLKELAETANIMKQAGFSAEVIADIMPDQVVPDVEEELKRQAAEREAMIPDIENMPEDNANMDENDAETA